MDGSAAHAITNCAQVCSSWAKIIYPRRFRRLVFRRSVIDLKNSPLHRPSAIPRFCQWSNTLTPISVYTKQATWENFARFLEESRGRPLSFIIQELVLHDDPPSRKAYHNTWFTEGQRKLSSNLRGMPRLWLTSRYYSSILESLPNLRILTLNSSFALACVTASSAKVVQGKQLQILHIGSSLWWYHPMDLSIFLLPFTKVDELVLDSLQMLWGSSDYSDDDDSVRQRWSRYEGHKVEIETIRARFTPLPPEDPYIEDRHELEIPHNLGWNALTSILKPQSLKYLKSREAAAFYPLELSEKFFRTFGPGLRELDCGIFCCSSDTEAPLCRQTSTVKHVLRLVQFCRGIDKLCFRVEPRGGCTWRPGVNPQPADEGWSIAMDALKRAEPKAVEITIHLVILFDKYDSQSDEWCRRKIHAAAHKLDYTLLHATLGKLPALREVTFRVGLRFLAVDKLDAPLAHHADEAVRVVQSLIDASNPARHYPDLRTRLSWTYVTDTHSP